MPIDYSGMTNVFPADPGSVFIGLFVGLGALIMYAIIAYMLWQIVRIMRGWADYQTKYDKFKEILLNRVAKKRGIDLDKEMTKMELMGSKKFEKRLQAELLAELEGGKVKTEE